MERIVHWFVNFCFFFIGYMLWKIVFLAIFHWRLAHKPRQEVIPPARPKWRAF